MMVDGSPRRGGSPEVEPKDPAQDKDSANPQGVPPPARDPLSGPTSVATPAAPGTAGATTNSGPPTTGAGRSRWLKLRTTVQLSGAITQSVHRRHPLKREDSFLTRFSTRQMGDNNLGRSDRVPVTGESTVGGPGPAPPRFWYSPFVSVIHPDENAFFVWLWVLTGCVLYNAWTLIARQAFPEMRQSAAPLWYGVDIFSDIVFLMDIAVQFRTGYLEQGLMVCEPRKLWIHYLKSKCFIMDLVALTPLEVFHRHSLPLLRFPRFLKIYRSYRFYYMVESRTIYPNLWRVVNLIHILLLLAHWFGGFYYMLAELEDFNGPWAEQLKPRNQTIFLARKYLASVYWSTLTLTTIGDLATPASNLQYIFTILSYLIGVFVFATIVGQVGNVITNRNASRLEFERLLDGAKLYMRHHKVPRNMQRRVQRWYDYSWSRGRMQGGGDINSALGILPDKLKTELALHVNLKTLKKVSIFQECQPEFLHDLVLKMKAYIFTPGDLICRKGEVAREMFIIADGVLEVISESGKVLTQMRPGDFFGEIGILNLDGFNRRTADVRSVGYSELFSLSREDVLTAMKDYPEAQDILQTMGRKRLMEARLAAVAVKKEDIRPPLTGLQPPAVSMSPAPGSPGPGTSQKEKGRFKPSMQKLKKDVRSLHKFLRSGTDAKSKQGTNVQLEMAPLSKPPHLLRDGTQASDGKEKEGRTNRIQRFISKIHSRSGDSNSSLKGLVTKIPCISPEPKASGSYLNDQIPAPAPNPPLQTPGPIGEGLPLLERIKLLRQMELAKEAAEKQSSSVLAKPSSLSTTDTEVVKHTETKPKPSFKSMFPLKSAAASSGLQVQAEVVTQQPPVEPPKPSIKIQEESSVPCEKQIPLLKKVLLRKYEEPVEGTLSPGATSSPPNNIPPKESVKESVQSDETGTQSDSNTSEILDCDNQPSPLGSTTTINSTVQRDTLPIDYQLIPENIKRKNSNNSNQLSISSTEHGSSDNSSVTTVRSARMVSSSSSIDSNIIVTPELLRAPTLEGYAARRTRLVRMQAFEFDSQEEDAALQSLSNLRLTSTISTAVQTDDYQHDIYTNIDFDDFAEKAVSHPMHRGTGGTAEGTSEALLEVYFGRVMKCMKQVLKTYLEEAQCDLQGRIQRLQSELQQKTILIGELQEALHGQEPGASATGPSSLLEDVSSISSILSTSSSSSASGESDDEDDGDLYGLPGSSESGGVSGSPAVPNPTPKTEAESTANSSSTGSGGPPDEASEPKLDPGHRFSWPSSLSLATRRNIMKPTAGWKYASIDTHGPICPPNQADPPALNPDDLWLTEFPTSTEALMSPMGSRLHHRQTRGGSLPSMGNPLHQGTQLHQLPGWSARLQLPPPPRKSRSPDWELKMLVQQFDRKLKERRKRRHSSGEVLASGSIRKKHTSTENVAAEAAAAADDRPRQLSLGEENKTKRWPLLRRTSTTVRRFSLPQFMTRSSSDAKKAEAQQKLNEIQQKQNEGQGKQTEAAQAKPEDATCSPVKPPSTLTAAKRRLSFFQNKQLSVASGESQESLVRRMNAQASAAIPHSSSFTEQASSSQSQDTVSSQSNFMLALSNHIKSSSAEPQPRPLPRQTSSYKPESFSSLHALPTICEDDYSRPPPTLRELRFLHSQSFCEDYSTPFGDVVMGDYASSETSNSTSAQPNTSKTSLPESTLERAIEISDCSEETPLINQTVTNSVVISMPEYQPLLTPP